MSQPLLTTSEHSSCRDLASSPGGSTPGGHDVEASLLPGKEFLLDFPTNPPWPGSLLLTSTGVQLVQTAIPSPHACLPRGGRTNQPKHGRFGITLKESGSHRIACLLSHMQQAPLLSHHPLTCQHQWGGWQGVQGVDLGRQSVSLPLFNYIVEPEPKPMPCCEAEAC